LVGGWDSERVDGKEIREKWDARHAQADGPGATARVVTENLHLLPAAGRALDLACGRGANSLLLAASGLEVDAWDRSPVAIERLAQAAQDAGLNIECAVRDVVTEPPPADGYDVILVAHFLDRSLVRHLVAALKDGGILFYQTFTRAKVTASGPSDPIMRLADGELLEMFSQLRPRVYREELLLGDLSQGWRDLAMLVAQKVNPGS
jgi:tellurite methyltransferase